METLILMADTIAIILVVVFSLRNEKREQGTPEFGPFRLKPARQMEPEAALVPVARRRSRRRL